MAAIGSALGYRSQDSSPPCTRPGPPPPRHLRMFLAVSSAPGQVRTLLGVVRSARGTVSSPTV
ncbi:hypothetical protein ACFQY7_41040 [Actinomadura luteofluorescens]|uniref:hypothetical protein n=1 Tax=Actinomadura luteofluorescens TaxID=46163 RepID=UPI003627B903